MTKTTSIITPPSISKLPEIVRLHGEILDGLRASLTKAIRIGEILTEVKAGLQHGSWLPWLAANVPFTDQTARNYLRLFEKREVLKFKTVLNLTDAYKLLADTSSADRLAVIETRINPFIEPARRAAIALCEIRDKRLYRADYETFKEYCAAKLPGMDFETVNFVMGLAETSENRAA